MCSGHAYKNEAEELDPKVRRINAGLRAPPFRSFIGRYDRSPLVLKKAGIQNAFTEREIDGLETMSIPCLPYIN